MSVVRIKEDGRKEIYNAWDVVGAQQTTLLIPFCFYHWCFVGGGEGRSGLLMEDASPPCGEGVTDMQSPMQDPGVDKVQTLPLESLSGLGRPC